MSRVEPYFADHDVILYHGDMAEVLPQLRSFDLVVADPPYGETSLDWDTYPTGWPQLLTDHTASMWCFGSMRMFLDHWTDFAAWRLSQDVVWDKGRATSPAADRFRRVHEHVLHFYRGPWRDLYHQAPRVHVDTRGRHAYATTRHAGPSTHSGYRPSTWTETGTRLVESVLHAPKNRTKSINPTEKPVSVLELLIQYACPPGGTVLDVFGEPHRFRRTYASRISIFPGVGERPGPSKRMAPCPRAPRHGRPAVHRGQNGKRLSVRSSDG